MADEPLTGLPDDTGTLDTGAWMYVVTNDGNSRRTHPNRIAPQVDWADTGEAGLGTDTGVVMAPLTTFRAIRSYLPSVYVEDVYGVSANNTAADNAIALAAISSDIASGAGGRELIFPRGVISTNATWTFTGRENVIMQGEGGTDIDFGTKGTELSFTDTGSATGFDFSNTKGLSLRDIAWRASSGLHSGVLMNMGSTVSVWNNHSIKNCTLYGTTPFNTSALLYARNVVNFDIRDTRFARAQIGLTGGFTGETATGTALFAIDGCDFTILENCGILNPGFGWNIRSGFEITSGNAPSGIKHTSNYDVLSLNLSGSKFADATAAGDWVQLGHAGGGVFGLTMAGGSMGGDGIADVAGFVLTGAFGVSITGVLFSGLARGIEVTSASTGVFWAGCSFPNTTTPITDTGFLDAGSRGLANNPASANFNANSTGTIGGSTGTADNRLLRSDGGAGATIQASHITVTDTGDMTGVQAFTADGLITAAGGQIAFPASQNASAGANTLDDYEEGTWTPAITIATAGDLSVVMSVQAGEYTKIGDTVLAWYNVLTTTWTHTTASGNVQITGWPFTSKNVGGNFANWRGLVRQSGFNKATYTQVNTSLPVNTATSTFAASGMGVSAANIVAADAPSGTQQGHSGALVYKV